MSPFAPELFASMLALTGAVIVVSALLSGLVERSGVPQVAVFLALGAIVGPVGLGLLDAGVDSPLLRVVATLSLALVLFTDALSLDMAEVRQHRTLAFLVLGPATLATAALIGLAAHLILGVPGPLAAILGAALASTDPVLLRGLLRDQELDTGVRQALRLESGLNDATLLPIVLVAMAFAGGAGEPTGTGWARLGLNAFVLSPAAGAAVGLLAVAALELVRRKMGVRRDYESLYSLGVAFAAFAAAEAMHGSGFLSAFAAGITIAALNVELCDCFLEYGQTTAEMALVFTFVLFGTSLIWSGLGVIGPATLLFAATVFLLRPLAFLPTLSLLGGMSWRNRLLIAWFGPRGLSSLLLVLVPVFAGTPGARPLVAVACLVVLISIVAHGLSPALLLRGGRGSPPARQPAAAPPRAEQAGFIDLAQVEELERENAPLVIVDARSERSFNESPDLPRGAVRLHPDRAVADAQRAALPRDATLAVLCA